MSKTSNKSELYKHVYHVTSYRHYGNREWLYRLNIDGVYYAGAYLTEKEAALACDKKLLSLGLEPVNILKRMN